MIQHSTIGSITYLYIDGDLSIKIKRHSSNCYYVEVLNFEGVIHTVQYSYFTFSLSEAFVLLRYHLGA